MKNETSVYEETYDWISSNLNESPKASLTIIASVLSSVIHGMYGGKPSPDITNVLCGIRNAIWEWEGNLRDNKGRDD